MAYKEPDWQTRERDARRKRDKQNWFRREVASEKKRKHFLLQLRVVLDFLSGGAAIWEADFIEERWYQIGPHKFEKFNTCLHTGYFIGKSNEPEKGRGASVCGTVLHFIRAESLVDVRMRPPVFCEKRPATYWQINEKGIEFLCNLKNRRAFTAGIPTPVDAMDSSGTGASSACQQV